MHRLGCRLMAGQRILVPSMGVRLPPSQPMQLLHMARSSSGLGRRPLKAEITSSNLVRATKQDFGELLTRFAEFLFRTILAAHNTAAHNTAAHNTAPGKPN